MNPALRLVSTIAACAVLVQTAPHFAPIRTRSLLGTSFGVPGNNATFDYIVVGGGTAGLTLATRLAEQQSGSVAVIEAGGFYEIGNGNISQVPATDGVYSGRSVTDWQPLVDWGYVTTPQAVSSQTGLQRRRLADLALGIRRSGDPLCSGKMPRRKLGQELHGLPARHALVLPEVGRCCRR